MKLTPLEAAHETVKGLHRAGLADIVTMREFDAECLPKINDLSADQIKTIRRKEKVSQTVFAKLLNTTLSTISQWEQGDKPLCANMSETRKCDKLTSWRYGETQWTTHL